MSTSCSISGVLFHCGAITPWHLVMPVVVDVFLSSLHWFSVLVAHVQMGEDKDLHLQMNNIFSTMNSVCFCLIPLGGSISLLLVSFEPFQWSAQTWGRFLFLNNWFFLSFSFLFFLSFVSFDMFFLPFLEALCILESNLCHIQYFTILIKVQMHHLVLFPFLINQRACWNGLYSWHALPLYSLPTLELYGLLSPRYAFW